MSEPSSQVEIREIPIGDLAVESELYARFETIHERGWLRHGIRRWLTLLSPASKHPVVVLGAWDLALAGSASLCGAIVGVWGDTPVRRFDDLLPAVDGLEPELAQVPDTRVDGPFAQVPDTRANSPETRPSGGFWHFVAVTKAPDTEHRVANPLLEAALEFVQNQRGAAQARTLSPIGGLDRVWTKLGDGQQQPPPATFVRQCLESLCTADGKGHFPITWLHPARGATLEAVLHDSRRDERRSCAITLRFAYDLDPQVRAENAAAWAAFLAARGEAVRAGRAREAGIEDRYFARAPLPPCLRDTDWG